MVLGTKVGTKPANWRRRTAVLVLLVVAAAALGGAGQPRTKAAGTVPVSHVVVILQENHSFDNVLGQLCIKDRRDCDAAASGKRLDGTTVPLTKATDVIPEVGHLQAEQLLAMDNGKMDGWEQLRKCSTDQCYSQFQPEQIPSLAALSRSGAISDNFFSRDVVPSWGGHLDLFAQTLDGFVGNNPTHLAGAPAGNPGWGCDSNLDERWSDPTTHALTWEPSCIPDSNGKGPYRPSPVQYVPTIGDRLDAAGKSWGIYTQPQPVSKGSNLPYAWSTCPTFAECFYGPQRSNMHQLSQLFTDAASGTLPSFALVLPDGNGKTSQHNLTSMMVGDNQIGKEVSAIQNGPAGQSTTIFIYYDDCGCFYDHVPPPAGLGIRLPLTIVSPYAKVRYTDHSEATNSSILAYMEKTLGVAPVTNWDATAYDFHNSFDYSQTPTPPFQFHAAPVPRSSLGLSPPPDPSGT